MNHPKGLDDQAYLDLICDDIQQLQLKYDTRYLTHCLLASGAQLLASLRAANMCSESAVKGAMAEALACALRDVKKPKVEYVNENDEKQTLQ